MKAVINNIPVKTSETGIDLPGSFEEHYIRLRQKEGRLYTDEVVRQLPHAGNKDPFYREWKMRAQSAKRLFDYLHKKKRPLKILEVGCGNGWLANYLAEIPGATVTGLDINRKELIQASRVFQKPNLRFVEGNFRNEELNFEKFDVILFAASIQYFSSLQAVITIALGLLRAEGEIHIMDSHFYPAAEIVHAQKRTAAYFDSIGLTSLCMYYFHHPIEALEKTNYTILYKPGILNRVFKNRNPFTWYCINHDSRSIHI